MSDVAIASSLPGQSKPGEAPLVSIICIAYNQKKYIAQTIEGFLMQQTNFNFEIIVHDDASTDGTAEIIREYAQKHPGLFKLILQEENQYSRHGVAFLGDLYRKTTGTYVCVCEGDDYWIDPQKLQLQVDFLEAKQDYAVCFHPVKVVFEHDPQKEDIFPLETSGFTTKKLLAKNFIQTNSVMYRRQTYEHIPTDVTPIDWYMHLYHAQFGKIGFINKAMAVYRRHPGGIWWDAEKDKDAFWIKNGAGHIRLFANLLDLFKDNKQYVDIINQDIINVIGSIFDADKDGTQLKRIFQAYPAFSYIYIAHVKTLLEKEQKANAANIEQVRAFQNDADELRRELHAVRSSKAYKAGTTLLKPGRIARNLLR